MGPLKSSCCGAAAMQSSMSRRANEPRTEPSDAGEPDAVKKRAWILRIISGTHVVALADQAIVSGTSFLTIVLVGRWTVPSELGVYSIGISLLASLLAVQDSLILLPYTIQRHRSRGTPAEHAGSALAHNGLLTALGVVTIAATAWGLSVRHAEPALVTMIWMLAAMAPFALLREFGRGFAFAHIEMTKALILDIAVSVMTLGAIGWLGWTGRMSATTACAALGVAYVVTGGAWLYIARSDFSIRLDQVRETTKQSWGLGKWLCAGQITLSVQGYGTYWLLPLLLGYTATGVYAASMSIASLANPLLAAFRNILTPRSVLALREGGVAQLRRQVIRNSLVARCRDGLVLRRDLVRRRGGDAIALSRRGVRRAGLRHRRARGGAAGVGRGFSGLQRHGKHGASSRHRLDDGCWGRRHTGARLVFGVSMGAVGSRVRRLGRQHGRRGGTLGRIPGDRFAIRCTPSSVGDKRGRRTSTRRLGCCSNSPEILPTPVGQLRDLMKALKRRFMPSNRKIGSRFGTHTTAW